MRQTWIEVRIQDAIRSARVTPGMTRDQVAMALGYPVTSETPHLDLSTWRYWLWTLEGFRVLFDETGLVSGVQARPELRDRVFLP